MNKKDIKLFEANFLDGDSINDCGGAKFSVSGVMDIVDFFEENKRGCKKCLGKGYLTELKGRGELPKKFSDPNGCYTYSDQSGKQIGSFTKMRFCDCDRGRALEKLIN